MSWYNKVVWSEGLFLRPQLFQQQERYLEHYAHKRAAALGPFFWGFHHYRIDVEALALGKLAMSGAAGVFQDGTPFDAPAHAALPAPLTVQHEHLNQVIHLAVPIRLPHTEETTFYESGALGALGALGASSRSGESLRATAPSRRRCRTPMRWARSQNWCSWQTCGCICCPAMR